MSEQSLQVGERRHTESGDILALSRLPVETGAAASDPFPRQQRTQRVSAHPLESEKAAGGNSSLGAFRKRGKDSLLGRKPLFMGLYRLFHHIRCDYHSFYFR